MECYIPYNCMPRYISLALRDTMKTTDIFPATAIAFGTGTLFPVRSFKNLGRGILASVMGVNST